MNDLSLIETETLLTEVFNRFDSIVIMGVQRGAKPHQDTFYHRYAGGFAACLGLTNLLNEIIKEDYKLDGKFNA